MPQRIIQKPLDSTPHPDNDFILVDSESEGTRKVSVRNVANQGGVVLSVNGEVGDVVLDADDIDDFETSKKFVSEYQLQRINLIRNDQGSDTFLSGDGEYRNAGVVNATNIGNGAGVLSDIASGTLRLKSLVPGANTTFDVGAETIVVNSFGSSNVVRDVIPAGTPSPYTINHNLNNYDLIVQAYDNVTKENVIATITRTDENNLSIAYDSELENDTVVLIISGEVASTAGTGQTMTYGDGLYLNDGVLSWGGQLDAGMSLNTKGNYVEITNADNAATLVSKPGITIGGDSQLYLTTNDGAGVFPGVDYISSQRIELNAMSGFIQLTSLNRNDTTGDLEGIVSLSLRSTESTKYVLVQADNGIRYTLEPISYTATTLVPKAYVDRHQLTSYTVSTLPSASPAGKMIFVSDESGGSVPAFSDGTNWRRMTDRNIVS